MEEFREETRIGRKWGQLSNMTMLGAKKFRAVSDDGGKLRLKGLIRAAGGIR